VGSLLDAIGCERRSVATRGRAPVAASVGVALYPEDGRDLQTLLRKADEAMYAAKLAARAARS